MMVTRRAVPLSFRWHTAVAWLVLFLVLFLVLVPPVRRVVEASMSTHMLIQFPCLMLVGALLVKELPARWLSTAQRWNELGITGLVGAALTLAVLMVPRVLDLALVDARVEALKLIALVVTGAALRLSWQRAGVVVQAFFMGNMLPMTVVIGSLYRDSPARVCNAYRLDDQQALGLALIVIAIATAALWLSQIAVRLTRATAGPR